MNTQIRIASLEKVVADVSRAIEDARTQLAKMPDIANSVETAIQYGTVGSAFAEKTLAKKSELEKVLAQIEAIIPACQKAIEEIQQTQQALTQEINNL